MKFHSDVHTTKHQQETCNFGMETLPLNTYEQLVLNMVVLL